MRDRGLRGADAARELDPEPAADAELEGAAVGRRARTGALREALYRHAVTTHRPDRERAARTAELVAAAIGGGGQSLPDAVRRRLEAIVQADLGRVRVHTGAAADLATDAVGARAFAVGDDLVFADGAYAPGTADGDRLLAHEATHAARHRGAPGVADDAAAEAEAHAAADAAAAAGARTPDPAHLEAVRGLLRSIGVAIDPHDEARLAIQYGGALGLTRWSLGADRQDAAVRVVALVEHARAHQCDAACAHPPRAVPLDDATRATVARTTGVALGDVQVETDAALGVSGRLGEARGDTIRLAPAASGDDALGRKVRLHEAIHVAQGQAADTVAPTDRTAAVEAEAHAATAAAERGDTQPLGVKADPATPYGFDLGDVASALHIDPIAFLREHFPQIGNFFAGGFGPMLQQLGDLANSALQATPLGRFTPAALEQGFHSMLASFENSQAFGILTGCCECLEHALGDVTTWVQGALHSGAADTIRNWLIQAQESENNDLINQMTGFFELLHLVGGPILRGIDQVSAWIDQADQLIGHSTWWPPVARFFGLDPSLAPIEAIKKKLSDMWAAVQADIDKVRHALSTLWAKIRANPIVAGITRFFDDCGTLITAIRHVREARSRDPQVWLGILARELHGTIFEGLVTSLQHGYTSVLGFRDDTTTWLMGMLDSVGLLSVWNAAVPYLNAIGHFIQGVAQAIQRAIQTIRTKIQAALTKLSQAIQDLWHAVEPYVSFVVGLGVAIYLTFQGVLPAIPMFLLGQLWLHVLPHCYKEALTNFLLDIFIAVAEWFPARHPVMILMRSAGLAFLHRIRSASADQKIAAMDTIAKVLSFDVEVLAGFFVGVVEGLWNSSLGFIAQAVIWPIQMIGGLLLHVGEGLANLAGQPFAAVFAGAQWVVNGMANAQPAGPGATTPAPGAPATGTTPDQTPDSPQPQVRTPAEVTSAPPAPADAEDIPLDGSAPAPSTPPPSGAPPSPEHGEEGGPAASPTFDAPPPFPGWPEVRALFDAAFHRGISREQVEQMFAHFNIAMDQWGTQLGTQAADRLMPFLTSASAPYQIGEVLGEVVGWLAGEIIMLVATDGIENLIADAAKGLEAGVEIVAEIAEHFPQLIEWLNDLRRALEPLIEAVGRIVEEAKALFERIKQWILDMIEWARAQMVRVMEWIEETFGAAGRAVRRGMHWLMGEAEEFGEAEEAAEFALGEMLALLALQVVPYAEAEAMLREIAVPHTPDMHITLAIETFLNHWSIRATARRPEGVPVEGQAIGRGAVLRTYETGIPYYTASSMYVEHQAILTEAIAQLEEEALPAEAEPVDAAYGTVEAEARELQEQVSAELPLRGTHFQIVLEPMGSRDVQHEHYSNTQFIITPNWSRKWARIHIGPPKAYGAVREGTGFRGSFEDPDWTWNTGWGGLYPEGPITRHPANVFLRYRSASTLGALKPSGFYTFVGGVDTPGGPEAHRTQWRTELDGQLREAREEIEEANPTLDPATVLTQAQERIVVHYQERGYFGLTWQDLYLQGAGQWQAHHIKEHSWGGDEDVLNFQLLKRPDEHQLLSNWWNRRRDEIKEALHL